MQVNTKMKKKTKVKGEKPPESGGVAGAKTAPCYKYSVKIHYRALEGSEREKMVLECCKEYGCEPNTHLIDRLLEDRYSLFEQRKQKAAELAEKEKEIAHEKRKLFGGA